MNAIRHPTQPLVDRLLRLRSEEAAIIDKMCKMVSLADVLEQVPEDNIRARAKRLGISRQHYYNMHQGKSRADERVAKRLAALTGVPEETILEIG